MEFAALIIVAAVVVVVVVVVGAKWKNFVDLVVECWRGVAVVAVV